MSHVVTGRAVTKRAVMTGARAMTGHTVTAAPQGGAQLGRSA